MLKEQRGPLSVRRWLLAEVAEGLAVGSVQSHHPDNRNMHGPKGEMEKESGKRCGLAKKASVPGEMGAAADCGMSVLPLRMSGLCPPLSLVFSPELLCHSRKPVVCTCPQSSGVVNLIPKDQCGGIQWEASGSQSD